MLARPATEVAPLLLGATLSRGEVTVRLTEVEAYLGDGVDPGSHAFRGRTRRNATMFGEPGHLYSYFTYGMHVCANVVCSSAGTASGVLLRAGEIVEGMELARLRRASSRTDADLARGPARLAVALAITLADDGLDLASGPVRLELPATPSAYKQGPRTGVSGPGGTVDYPWRFWIPGDPTVSPYRPHIPKTRS
ncbi:MAG: DNA-3-methyladenine glycosylase [Lacisediminihabitans sp.]